MANSWGVSLFFDDSRFKKDSATLDAVKKLEALVKSDTNNLFYLEKIEQSGSAANLYSIIQAQNLAAK